MCWFQFCEGLVVLALDIRLRVGVEVQRTSVAESNVTGSQFATEGMGHEIDHEEVEGFVRERLLRKKSFAAHDSVKTQDASHALMSFNAQEDFDVCSTPVMNNADLKGKWTCACCHFSTFFGFSTAML